jgi:hypothetical protein
MNKRNLMLSLLGLFAVVAAVFGYNLTSGPGERTEASKGILAKKQEAKLQDACSSSGTYAIQQISTCSRPAPSCAWKTRS